MPYHNLIAPTLFYITGPAFQAALPEPTSMFRASGCKEKVPWPFPCCKLERGGGLGFNVLLPWVGPKNPLKNISI